MKTPHWTISASREETLAVWKKFRKISERKPNHKLLTIKVITRAKMFWDRYVIHDDLLHPSNVTV